MRDRGTTQNRTPRPPIIAVLAAVLGMVTTNIRAQSPKSFSDSLLSAAASQAAKDQETWVPIVAFVEFPLGEAVVEVHDINGRRIFNRNKATNAPGVFSAKVRDLPRDFRVTGLGTETKQTGIASCWAG